MSASNDSTPTTLAILGAGRAGCSLHHALSASKRWTPLLWTRREETARAARQEGFDVQSGPMSDAIRDASVIVLAVSDSAVEPLARELAADGRARPSQTVIHLAGALDLSPLDPLRSTGASVGSLHPLSSLASRRASLTGFAAAIDADSPSTHALLERIADDAGLIPFTAPSDRAMHHAACCIVGNFPQVLLEAGMRVLVAGGVDVETARKALGPLLVGAANNAFHSGPANGLTGPVSRGDSTTVRRHLAALSTVPSVEPIYREASRIAVDLAADRGVADEHLESLRELLEPDAES